MIDQVPFRDLTTPVGIVLAGTLIRQIIEIAKKSFLPWLDAGNERKGVAILAIILYGAWLAAYGRDLTTDGWQALFAALAVCGTAIGTNETIDAARKAGWIAFARPSRAASGSLWMPAKLRPSWKSPVEPCLRLHSPACGPSASGT
jgi:hypothetical protein